MDNSATPEDVRKEAICSRIRELYDITIPDSIRIGATANQLRDISSLLYDAQARYDRVRTGIRKAFPPARPSSPARHPASEPETTRIEGAQGHTIPQGFVTTRRPGDYSFM